MGRGVDGPDNLNDPLAQWLRDGGETSRLPVGAELRQVVHHSLCLLTDGWLQRSRPIDGGRSATLAVYLPGDLVMLDVWSGAADRDQVTAITECELLCRPLSEFDNVVDAQGELARGVIRRLAQDTELLREGLTAISRMDAS